MELYWQVKITINVRAKTQDSNHLNYVRVKVKVKAFILSTPRRCIEGVEEQLQLFLTSALDVRVWPTYPRARNRVHWTAGCVDPSADLDILERRQIFFFHYSVFELRTAQPAV